MGASFGAAAGTAAALLLASSITRAAPPEPVTTPKPEKQANKAPPADKASPAAPNGPVDVVVTGTRAPEDARRSPVRVDVVTGAEAARRGATNVGEALAFSLGTQVNPAAYGALGQPSAIQIGGLDLDRVLVLEDGERVIGDTGGAIDLSQIPIADVSRIETMQGPASALYGTSAIGGVVNVVTQGPEIEGPSGRVRLEYRSPEGVLALGSAAYRSGDHWGQVDGSFARSAGIALDPKLPDLAMPEIARGFVGLRAGTKVAKGTTVTARVRFAREHEDGLQTQLVPGLGRFTIDLPATSDRFNARLRETIVLDGGHEINLSAGKQWFWNTSANDRRDSPVDQIRTRAHTMHSAEATASLFPGRTWSGIVGARFEAESFSQSLRRTDVNGAGELETTDLVEVPETSLATGALYGQLKVKPGSMWTLLGGARIEGNTRYGVAAAPSLGVAFMPRDGLILRAHGGRGYRAPSAKELGFVFDHSVYGYRVVGNPALTPETSWGIGADVEVSPSRRLRARASFFANWVEDMINLELAPDIPAAGGVSTYTYRNVSAARTAGVSIDASARASTWLRAEVGWAYVFTRDESIQRPLQGRPPHTVSASAIGSLPFGIEAVVRARFVTDAYITDELRTVGFGTMDVRVQKTLPAGILVYAGALNLMGAQKDPARDGDTRPIDGRVFYAGASARFPWES